MPIDGYFQRLFEMVAKPISEFKQGEHTGATPVAVRDEKQPTMQWTMPPARHTLVKGGFCHGASLDWLRKVIQREDAARYAITHRKWSRVSRMAQTHVAHGPARAAAVDAITTRAKATVTAANDARNAAIAQAKALLIDWAEGNGCTFEEDAAGSMTIRNAPTPEIHAMVGAKFDEYGDLVRQAVARSSESIAAANATVAQWNTATPGERMGILWSDIARQLGTDAARKRKFSGITPAAGSATDTYADLRAFVTDAVSARAFIPGRGMLISFAFVPPPGHSIAVHRETADSYVLFDPNLGIFRCKSAAKLVTALVVLIEECYLAPEAGKPAETARGSGHSWHVFCRTAAPIPGNETTNTVSLEDARIAFDAAGTARDSYAETTRFVVAEALQEAQRLHAAHEKDKGPASQRAWVEAHNVAVEAVSKSRMTDAEAKRTYADFRRATITLQ